MSQPTDEQLQATANALRSQRDAADKFDQDLHLFRDHVDAQLRAIALKDDAEFLKRATELQEAVEHGEGDPASADDLLAEFTTQ